MMTSSNNKSVRVIVSPSFPIEWRDVEDFLGEFGPYNGRYVPRFPNDWIKQLKSHLADIGPKERIALIELLRSDLLRCTCPINWSWDSSMSWAENVQISAKPTDYDIIAGDALEPTPYKPWSQIAGEVKSTRSRTLIFDGLVATYVDLCKPLLLNAPSVYLIDPYLDPFSINFENLLLYFFNLIKGSGCYNIELITRRQACGDRSSREPNEWMSSDAIYQKLKEVYGSRIPKGRMLKVHLVQEARDDGLTMHDRFFLTNHGAINFGHGFKISTQKKSMQNAFVVDKNHHEILKEIYIKGVARFHERLPRRVSIPYAKNVITLSLMRPSV
jgi:hypothetical protein